MSASSQLDNSGLARHRVLTALRSLLGPFVGLAVVMALFYVIDPSQPFGMRDIQTVAVHTMIVGVAAMGMTFVIISGGIDLSVGSGIALASVAAAMVLERGADWPVVVIVPMAVVAAIITGALCGLYNGLLITVLRLPPFIATLGTLGFFRGVAKWITGSIPVTAPTFGLEQWVRPAPTPEWLLFAPGVWMTVVLGVVLIFVLRNSLLGRYAFAIGSNEATARLCGIRVGRAKVMIYVLAGALVGLAGLLQFARLSQGDPTIAIGLELDVIAAVVIGGGSLAGGQGSLPGTLAGAFLMAYLSNRCTVLGWPNAVQEIIVGHVIIIAVALDQWRLKRSQH